MADTVGLKLILDAQIKDFDKAISELEKRIDAIAEKTDSLSESATNLADGLNQAAPATAATAEGVEKLGEKVKETQEAVEKYSEATGEVEKASEQAAKGVKEAGKGAGEAKKPLEEAEEGATDLVDALSGTVGLAAASAIATDLLMKFAFAGLDVSDVLHGTAIAFTDAEQAQFAYNHEVAASIAKGQGEVDMLESLIGVVKDTASTRQQQADAIKVINDKYPEYLENLSAEAINTNAATVAIGKQVELILLRSKIQGAQAAYDKALAKQAEATVEVEQKKIESMREANELATGQSNILKETVKMVRDVGNSFKEHGVSNQGFSIVEKAQKDLEDANTLVDVIKKNLDEAFNEAKEKGLLDKIFGGAEPAAKAVRTVTDVLSDLDKEMKAIKDRSDLVGTSIDELAGQRLQALNKAFDEIAKISGPDARNELEKIAKEINTISASVLGVQKIDTKQIFTFSSQKVKDSDVVGKNTKDVIALDLPVKVTFSELEPGIKAAQQELNGGIKTLTDGAEVTWNDGIAKLEEAINLSLKNLQTNLIYGVADNIGQAIGGGSVDFVGSFLDVLGSGLQQLGKLLVAWGIALKGFNISLETLNPYLAIAAGAAAIIAGGAVKAFAKKGIKSYAIGGITDGPTLAMVGDNPSGREAMIPEELWPYLGGGGAPIYVENHIDASGLVTIVKRGLKEEARVR